MSNQPTQILYGSGEPMEIENSVYTCPYCHADILLSNRDTHEARCARMNKDQIQAPTQSSSREQPQNIGRQEQRDTNGLRITREHSSSSIPYPEQPTNQMRQPQVRREARRVAENKLMTCANCEKSVREDDLVNHQRYECQGSDKIPCEFCDKQVSMTEYQDHVDHCPKRQEEAQQERARSLERQRQNEQNLRDIQADQRRVNSAERRPTSNVNFQPQPQPQPQRQDQQQQQQGQEGHGFMNFLKNLATAALQNRHDVEDSTQPQSQNQQREQQRQQREQQEQRQQREQQQRQQQEAQAQQPSFLARLLGFHPETPEETEQRRQQRALQQQREQQRRRAEMQRRQQEAEMLQNLFQPRSQLSEMEDMMMGGGRNQPQGHVRTIRFGPHGSVIISSSNRGSQQVPPAGYQPRQSQLMEHEMEEMGPLGVLLSMMNGGVPGMRVISPEELEGMTQEQQAGLAREVLDSLSVINYDKEKNKNVSEDLKSCPICIEDFDDGDEVRYLWCMHRFHKACVDKWLEKHSNCPICKKEYSESEVSYE